MNKREEALIKENDELKIRLAEAETALHDNEAQFHSVVENSRDVIYSFNLQKGFYEYVSPAFQTVTGYTVEEFKALNKNQNLKMIFHEDVETYNNACRISVRSGKADVEYRQRTKSGEYRWLSNNMYVVVDANGKPLYRNGHIRDITERKMIEDALRDSEERYAAIYNNSPIAISLTKLPEKLLVAANNAFIKLFGYSLEELSGKNSAAFSITDQESWELANNMLNENGFVHDFECQKSTNDKGVRTLLLNLDWITLSGQLYILTMVNDITDRKRMESELSEKQKENIQLAKLLDLSSQPFCIKMPDGRFGQVNHAFEILTGYSAEELQLLYWNKNLTAPEYAQVETRYLEQLVRTGKPVRYKKEYIRKDGTRIPVELIVNVKSDAEGNPEYFFAFQNDISERVKYEENLHQMIRTLGAMQKSSLMMALAVTEQEYLKGVCNTIVEECGHKMVWIGYKKHDAEKNVEVVTFCGFEKSYLDSLKISWDENTVQGRGPTGTAIRTRKYAECHNMLSDPNFEPWRKEALSRGFNSSIALPFFIDEEVIGAITIYSSTPRAFSEDEIQLLSKLAQDLGQGLKTIRLNSALQHAKSDLEIKIEQRTSLLKKTLHDLDIEKQRFKDLINKIPAYVALISPKHEIVFSNQHFKDYFGESNGKTCHEIFFGNSKECNNCKAVMVAENGKPYHWEAICRNKRTYQVSDFDFLDTDGRSLTLEIGFDVTEKKNIENYVFSKILETEERDRRRFASDLHDDLGPTLSAIKIQLSLLGKVEETKKKNELLEICNQLLLDGLDKMRTVANNIMPHLIESYGLETALKSFIEKIMKSGLLSFEYTSTLGDFRFDKEKELHIYRMITELISNTIKHSGASKVTLDIDLASEELKIVYFDNGSGYNPDKLDLLSSGIGIENIRNRTAILHGTILFINTDDKTTVIIQLPNAHNSIYKKLPRFAPRED
jgi:PAS domain S-box-containing protein